LGLYAATPDASKAPRPVRSDPWTETSGSAKTKLSFDTAMGRPVDFGTVNYRVTFPAGFPHVAQCTPGLLCSWWLCPSPAPQDFGQIAVANAREDSDLATKLTVVYDPRRVERAVLITVEDLDWNRPWHITPRFTQVAIIEALAWKWRRRELRTIA
jgi:hypothetical protein